MYYNGLQRIQLWFFPLKDERPKKERKRDRVNNFYSSFIMH